MILNILYIMKKLVYIFFMLSLWSCRHKEDESDYGKAELTIQNGYFYNQVIEYSPIFIGLQDSDYAIYPATLNIIATPEIINQWC